MNGRRIVMQSNDRNGWDCERVHTMEDIKVFLRHPHCNVVRLYVDDKEFIVPNGWCNLYDKKDHLLMEAY